MTIELITWNPKTGKYDESTLIEGEFAKLQDMSTKYVVRSIYTHPYSPEIRIFADHKENENA